jgi:hypothetical protein
VTSLSSRSLTRCGEGPGRGHVKQNRPTLDPNPCTGKDCSCGFKNTEILENLVSEYTHTRKQKKRGETRWPKGATAVEQMAPNPRDQRQKQRPPLVTLRQCPPPPRCRWPCPGPEESPEWEAYKGSLGHWKYSHQDCQLPGLSDARHLSLLHVLSKPDEVH